MHKCNGKDLSFFFKSPKQKTLIGQSLILFTLLTCVNGLERMVFKDKP
jgi:hypothetical protein